TEEDGALVGGGGVSGRRYGGGVISGAISCCGHAAMVSRSTWTSTARRARLRARWEQGAATAYPVPMSVDHADSSSHDATAAPAAGDPVLRIRRSGATALPHRAHADDAGLDLASAED